LLPVNFFRFTADIRSSAALRRVYNLEFGLTPPALRACC